MLGRSLTTRAKDASHERAKEIITPNFGMYHHTTPLISKKIRERVAILFKETFADLPFSREQKLKILDMGCGLGFLSCVAAEYYSNATITGFDIFGHASLRGSSLERAKANAKVLGFEKRITFEKNDFFHSDYAREMFDLFISNLVFENLGNRRFGAYARLAHWTAPKSYAVLGAVLRFQQRS